MQNNSLKLKKQTTENKNIKTKNQFMKNKYNNQYMVTKNQN